VEEISDVEELKSIIEVCKSKHGIFHVFRDFIRNVPHHPKA